MIDGPATLLHDLGALVCAWTRDALPALGADPGAAAVRGIAAAALLLAAGAVGWTAHLAGERLVRLLRAPWDAPARAVLPSLRLVTATLVVVIAMSPFAWEASSSMATPEDDADRPALAALIIAWIATAVIIIVCGNLLFRLVQSVGAVASSRAARTTAAWDDVLIEVAVRVALGFVVLGTIYVAIAVLADHPVLTRTTAHLLGLLVIALITWALVNLVHLVDRFLMSRYHVDGGVGGLQARRIATQVVVLKRMAYLVIGVFAVATALMQFESIRHVGTSILASAGLAGVVLGFAAQRTLGNVLAGIQIALTQPLRIDDGVLIEGEFGKVEEITLTYVVVAIWDGRRLIVPLSRIIEQPFQNWTRTTTEMLGTVTLRCDFSVPVADLRAEAKRFVESHRLWDKRAFAVQVTDGDHRAIEVRVLASAANGGDLFDLRCEVREHLVGWLNQVHPQALPHLVVAQEPRGPEVKASA